MPVTDRVTKQQCCGCSACSAICPQQCIEMKEDELGFFHPFVNSDSCIGCSLCEKVCPCLQTESSKITPELLFAAKIKDNSKLTQSTSGGVFTFLAEKVLKEQGVVCAARFDTPTHLIHDFCTRIKDLDAYKGSKYLQSDMRNCYLETESAFCRDILPNYGFETIFEKAIFQSYRNGNCLPRSTFAFCLEKIPERTMQSKTYRHISNK